MLRQLGPFHWAASSDDVDVAAALIDGGADIEAADGSIGTPLDNAVGYACWHVAQLLVARGAVVDKLWHAAALGLMDRLAELLDERIPCPPYLSGVAYVQLGLSIREELDDLSAEHDVNEV